jgi:soluble lytic murein transglycosylase-like protein
LVFSKIFARFSKAALLLGFVVIASISAETVQAQTPAAAPTQQPVAANATQPPATAKSELKNSLTELSTLYQNEVQRLEKQQQQSKELYDGGLISRVDFEKGEKALADARAKVEQVTQEIAAANQPAPVIGAEMIAGLDSSNTVWTTGNVKIDNLIRYYGAQHGVDPFLIYCLMSQESKFVPGAVSNK